MKCFAKLAVITATAVALVSCAETPTSPSGSSNFGARARTIYDLSGTMSFGDRDFIAYEASLARAMVVLGKLEGSSGDISAVKKFGTQMAQNYAADLAYLAEDSTDLGRSDLDSHFQQVYDRLLLLSGSKLDHVYLEATIEAFQDSMGRFRQESTSANSTALRDHTDDVAGRINTYMRIATELSGPAGIGDHDAENN